MSETILIVDDEEPVRRTFSDWLSHSGLECRLLVAADAESALKHANKQPIDLAILDWNLGSGSDGLQLLEDLSLFHPDVVAILITGFAHQATPLDALRMGVRDYLDKNQDLNRETFLASVRKQLERIIPAKRQRAFNQSLKEFRTAVEKILPLVQATSALNNPVPLPQAIGSLFRFVLRTTGAADGVLLVRFHPDGAGDENYLAYDSKGEALEGTLAPFAKTIAATAVSMQEPCVMNRLEEAAGSVEFQPFEKGRKSVLAAPLQVGLGLHVVMELFDKQFNDDDRRIALAAADFGGEILRQALAERQDHQLLFGAIEAALQATEKLGSAPFPTEPELEKPPPPEVLDKLRQGLAQSIEPAVDSDTSLRLAEAVRVLALRHGPAAVQHCIRLVQDLRELLDAVTGQQG
ncbi:MAG TPA: response regulator [Gemmataceae bacterium]|jgi:ActR/RegA family two-component response regulator|nr:response regulator [Gemmataceae bacterium]